MLDKKLFSNTSHASVYDYEFQKHLKSAPWQEWLGKSGYFEVKEEYLTKIHNWILSTKRNTVKGLERFKHRDLIHGTTQSFDEAYFRYKDRQLRIFRGEYAYHKRVNKNFKWLDDENGNLLEINDNDWIILSLPFCGNGGVHKHMGDIFDVCQQKNIPLLLDCAWFGTCENIPIDVNHPAITEVSFSLSKGIGLGNVRSGIRYSNYDDDGSPIRQQNNYNHLPLASAQIGIWQMEKFGPDYLFDKYENIRDYVCHVNGIHTTNCIHIGLLPKHHAEYESYLVNNLYSKVGIRQALKDKGSRMLSSVTNNIKKGKTVADDPIFCLAPFTSVYYKASQKIASFCCVQEERQKIQTGETLSDWWVSEHSKNMRKDFINGKWPSACSYCENKESAGHRSDRYDFRKFSKAIKSVSIDKGNEIEKPLYVDYRPDNLCNLMCTMCSPSNSNLVEKLWKQFPDLFPTKEETISETRKVEHDLIMDNAVINKNTIQLKVLGGEPTINSRVHDVFRYCIENGYDKNIDLKMTTNFTNINSTYELIDSFKSIKVNASLDGTGPTYEYIRRPAHWYKVKENIIDYFKRYENKREKYGFSTNVVFQLANAFTMKDWIPELFELYYETGKNIITGRINFLNCTFPIGTQLSALPDKMKDPIVKDIEFLLEQFKGKDDQTHNLKQLLSYVQNSQFTERDLVAYQKRFKAMDQYKKTDITSLHPAFEELMNYEVK